MEGGLVESRGSGDGMEVSGMEVVEEEQGMGESKGGESGVSLSFQVG